MIYDTIEYKGFEIEIHQDELPENPFEDWDCEAPIIVQYDGRLTAYGDIDATLPDLSRDEIASNLSDIVRMLGYGDKFTMLRDITYDGCYDITDSVNDAILDHAEYNDTLETIEQVYDWKGTPCAIKSSCGYSQGDYAEILIVLTDEFFKETGCKPEHGEAIMQGAADLYSAWAWDDVYGFTVDGIDDASCWVFYGSDHKKSGLLEHAKSDIDYHINHERKAHADKLKMQIKNHVPLAYRIAA